MRAPRRRVQERMNEPLEHKLFSVYGQILSERALRDAWTKVRANKGAGGVDGVSIAKFEEDLDGNIAGLLADLRAKEYKPSPVRRVRIPKKNGKKRPLGIPTIRDRIVQQALVTRLSPFFEENVFHRDSCGFRPGMGAEDALKKVMWNLETGCRYVYDLDIRGYFDNIPHKKLMRVLSKYVSDGTVLDLVWRSLKAGYMLDDVTYETAAGTMQGGVISPLLANVYLNELDWELHKAGLRFCRYADDCIVMCRDEAELESFCAENHVDAAFLCVPRQNVESTLERLYRLGIKCYWNFSHYDISAKYSDTVVENVHLSDNLMTLCYRMTNRGEQ
jgi:group II intron reverse transcriptase/maturase